MPSTKSLIKQSERQAKVGMQHPQVGYKSSGTVAETAIGLGFLAVLFWPITLGAYLVYRASRKKSK